MMHFLKLLRGIIFFLISAICVCSPILIIVGLAYFMSPDEHEKAACRVSRVVYRQCIIDNPTIPSRENYCTTVARQKTGKSGFRCIG